MSSDPLGGWGAYVSESTEAERSSRDKDEETRPGEHRNIWVYAEIRSDHVRASTYELMGRSREIADSLGARVGTFLFGSKGVGEHAKALIKAGADVVYVAESPLLVRQDPDVTATALARLAKDRRPELILLGQSTFGDSLAGRLAVMLDTAAVARVRDIAVDTSDRTFVFHQHGYDRRLDRQSVIPKAKPPVATILRRSFQRPNPDPSRTGRIVDVMPEIGPDLVRLTVQGDAPPAPPAALEDAPVVILCGKGIASKSGFERAQKLQAALAGAAMATSRSVADLGYGPRDVMVGIHGRRIRPQLLITLGLSGDLDTLEGIDRSRIRTWIAVDRDPEANILDEADVAVVAEWEPFVDALVATLHAEKRALAFE